MIRILNQRIYKYGRYVRIQTSLNIENLGLDSMELTQMLLKFGPMVA